MTKLTCFPLLIFLFPILLLSQSVPTVRMYGDGNTSIKINDSANNLSNAEKRRWLENGALAFSENDEELYFRHPTDNYYQVWNVTTKKKVSEITFSEAGNTPKGREVTAAFPNVIYRADANANSKIWLSADLNVSFDNRNKFKISGGQNQPDKSFTLKFLDGVKDIYSAWGPQKDFLKNAEIVNTRYQFYFHKKSNKLFIIAYADRKFKVSKGYFSYPYNSYPYNGVFCFDLASNMLSVLAEIKQSRGIDGTKYLIDRWYFFADNLVHNYISGRQSLFTRLSLATVTKQDLIYATSERPLTEGDVDGWRNPSIGTDLQDNYYFADPTNNNLQIWSFNKSGAKSNWATILNSSNKLNEVTYEKDESIFVREPGHTEFKNVLAISPSGKYFAYLSLNNRTGVGNYASIMMYNLNEKDRVYTLNDQTKYEPSIAKGYVTDNESEELAKKWAKIIEDRKIQKRKTYESELNALKAKIAAAKAEFDAYKKPYTDLYEAGDYRTVLINNKNEWYYSENLYDLKNYSFSIKVKFEIRGKDNVYAIIQERLQFPASYIYNGKLEVVSDYESNAAERYKDDQYEGVKYVTSKYDANVIETQGKGLSFQIIGDFQFREGTEVLNRSEQFKIVGDSYLGFLDKAKLSVHINPAKNFWIQMESKKGQKIIIEAKQTVEAMQLHNKVYELEKELEKLIAKIETEN